MKNILSLNGEWRLRAADEKKSYPCAIPGDNYSALQAAGAIPDPYYRRNEYDVQYVSEKDWIFSRAFEVSKEMLAHRAVYLSFESIDAIAAVRVNGRLVGKTENEFRAYRFDVKRFLREGENEVEVRVTSPRAAADAAAKKMSPPLPGSPNMTIRTLNNIRKCQCSSGWDWGVSLPTSGIYGETALFGSDDAVLDYLWCEQKHSRGKCRVTAVAELTAVPDAEPGRAVEVVFTFDGERRVARGRVPRCGGKFRVTAVFDVVKPRLWWPAGYGRSDLYELRAECEGRDIVRRIGLRTLEVINKPDSEGYSMIFRVNGVDVFAKGADWIPCDARPLHADEARTEQLLRSAVAANMNTLRVWGGGRYERDFFYDLCDRLGLLLWHDMMFACNIYPDTKDFLDNVREEALHQLKRLRAHPSIALWCGDNEGLGAARWYAVPPNREQMLHRHLVIYDRTNRVLSEAAAEADPSHVFWQSSPSAGPGALTYNDDGRPSGDTHFWTVWFGGATFECYYTIKPRFCSEYGFQSLPSPELVRSFAKKGDFNLFSPVMESHQKCPSGNLKIFGMFGNYFRMPKDFDSMLYLSQVQQAVTIRTGAEYWRSLRPHCMGVIFWQLNDDWPVASWSSIEFGGRWKALQYEAKRFYAPLAVSVFRKNASSKLEAHVVWDLPKKVSAKVEFTLRKIADGSKVASKTCAVSFATAGTRDLPIPDWGRDAAARRGLRENEVFVTAALRGKDADGTVRTHALTAFVTPWKNSEFPVSGVRVKSVKPLAGGSFEVSVVADRPAFFTGLAVPDDPKGLFDDNFVTVLPGETRKLRYTPGVKTAAAALAKAITVRDLRSSYDC